MEAQPPPQEAAQTPSGRPLSAGVQFRPASKVYTFLTDDATLRKDEAVIVETEGGSSLGRIASLPADAGEKALPQGARRILRRATAEELAVEAESREKALEYFAICRDRIRSREMPMKLIDVELEEEGRKAVFLFFAEQRVDFRNLVKDLAGLLHLRIEMRQVGSRDESKCIGCMGPCGLTTCCSTHLRQFQSISISMAKHQGLAPNPAKLTGMCNKLKCCLAYEQAAYDECRHGLPKVGAAVETPEGAGKVVGHNVLKRECIVRLYSGGESRLAAEKCRVLSQGEREAAITQARVAHEQHEARRAGRRQQRGNRPGNNYKQRRPQSEAIPETPPEAQETEKDGNDEEERS